MKINAPIFVVVVSLLMFPLLSSSLSVPRAVSAEIITCPGWKLNALPEVKRFVKDADGAALYPDIKVTFIPGHPPQITFKAADGATEMLEMGLYGFNDLHRLVQDRGLSKGKQEQQQPDVTTTAAVPVPAVVPRSRIFTSITASTPRASSSKLISAPSDSAGESSRSSDIYLYVGPLLLISAILVLLRYSLLSSSSSLMFALKRQMAMCGWRFNRETTSRV